MRGAARYQRLFDSLADKGEGAFVPFGVLGDPDPGTSLEIIRTFARSGADAVELGIPFSDPVADGVWDSDNRPEPSRPPRYEPSQ